MSEIKSLEEFQMKVSPEQELEINKNIFKALNPDAAERIMIIRARYIERDISL